MTILLQIALATGFGLFLFWLIGQMIRFFAPGYVSLEHRNKSTIRSIFEGIIDFIKIFKFW